VRCQDELFHGLISAHENQLAVDPVLLRSQTPIHPVNRGEAGLPGKLCDANESNRVPNAAQPPLIAGGYRQLNVLHFVHSRLPDGRLRPGWYKNGFISKALVPVSEIRTKFRSTWSIQDLNGQFDELRHGYVLLEGPGRMSLARSIPFDGQGTIQ
jgi:hypothetical protein